MSKTQITITERKTKKRTYKDPDKQRHAAERLKPYHFKPGQSGNPSGRPRGSGTKKISAAYEAYLEQKIPADDCARLGIDYDAGITWSDMIAIQTMRRSLGLVDGDKICFTAITELREVTEGKIPERAELTGRDGKPLQPAQPPVFNIRFKSAADSENPADAKENG